MRSARSRVWIGAAALLAAGGMACDSTHDAYQNDAVEPLDTLGDPGGETVAEGGDDAAEGGVPVTTASCGSTADGVAVEGVITFSGAVPAPARLWVFWFESLASPGMPACVTEITPAAFPAGFRFTDVPRGETWALQALLDADGGFPPMPVVGDWYAAIPDGEVDLSRDQSGLVLELQPYAEP